MKPQKRTLTKRDWREISRLATALRLDTIQDLSLLVESRRTMQKTDNRRARV